MQTLGLALLFVLSVLTDLEKAEELYSRPVLKVLPSASVWSGEAVTLQCLVERKQQYVQLKYSFFKDSKGLRYTGSEPTLKIGSADAPRIGKYHCEAGHEEEGMRRSSVPVMLNVESGKPKPVMTAKGRKLINGNVIKVLLGESFTLKCEIPKDNTGWKYTWRNFDDDLQADGCQETGQTYSVSYVKESNGGIYWCQGHRGDFYSDFSEPLAVQVVYDRREYN
ncbi:Fc receptor-like protein 6 [Polypterus senegalus]|uniref:Fc receptor-like protein 6 n=1 Tax=Polypterus senegalus TaxID=55291 RepID=UPI001966493F|nr:Fc receptor-like protein 6 [Polypterus senegalus]